ncbi:MAG: 30S ribosomal protein S13, partial [Candidatus Hecatellales archaeon]
VRICGTDIDGSKKLAYGLAKIKGVGVNFGKAVALALNLNPDQKIGYLSDEDVKRLEDAIANPQNYGIPSFLYDRRKDLETGKDLHLHGADLELRQKLDIEFLKALKCWRGIRHMLGLKVRGQKTRTTGRKGKTVGVSRRRT